MCTFSAIGDKEKCKKIIKEQFAESDHKNQKEAADAVIGLVDLFEDPEQGQVLKVDVNCHAHQGYCTIDIQKMSSTYTG